VVIKFRTNNNPFEVQEPIEQAESETNPFIAIQYTQGEAIYEDKVAGEPVNQPESFEVQEPIEQAESETNPFIAIQYTQGEAIYEDKEAS
jgi:hypothetical protein